MISCPICHSALPAFLAYWIHSFSPFLVRFGDNFGIRYYGLAYLLGFAGAVGLLHLYHRTGRSPFGANTITDLMMYIVFGVLVGGRVGYFLLYQPATMLRDPIALFRIWEGGMASHGGFVGVAVTLWWWTHKRKVPIFHISDLIVTTVPLGLMLGRIANFINGELWGKTTDMPWGVVFEKTGGGPFPRHPSQLYEAGLEGLLLLACMQWRFWKSDAARTRPGRLSGEFLVAYALVRALGEIFREPDAAPILGLSRGTFYSLFLVAGGLALIALTPRLPPSSRASPAL